jgi:hypothetical protein
MKLTLAKILCATTALALLSCEKQDIKQPEVIKRKFARELHYMYKGGEIKLQYIAQGDSFAVVNDDNAKRLDYIFSLPKQVTFVDCKNPKTLYLYDTYKDFESAKGASVAQPKISPNTNNGNSSTTAARTVLCGTIPPSGYLYNRVSLFENDNFGGDEWLLNYTSLDPNNKCLSRLSADRMGAWNDRLSSFILNADFPPGQATPLQIQLRMFTSEYYDGSVLFFQTNPGDVGHVEHMSDYSYGSFFSSRSWNDEPSSFQLNTYLP